MNELSIFIDESGDFGEYDYRSPYYIIAMVFHKQEHSIHEAVDKLNHELSYSSSYVLYLFLLLSSKADFACGKALEKHRRS